MKSVDEAINDLRRMSNALLGADTETLGLLITTAIKREGADNVAILMSLLLYEQCIQVIADYEASFDSSLGIGAIGDVKYGDPGLRRTVFNVTIGANVVFNAGKVLEISVLRGRLLFNPKFLVTYFIGRVCQMLPKYINLEQDEPLNIDYITSCVTRMIEKQD